eukprot:3695490-Rhodomonas_salina.1
MPTGAVAHYAILDHSVFDDANNVKKMGEWGHLLQSLALDLWRLKEPKVLISVTGGAIDFAMSRLDEDTVMQVLLGQWPGLGMWKLQIIGESFRRCNAASMQFFPASSDSEVVCGLRMHVHV